MKKTKRQTYIRLSTTSNNHVEIEFTLLTIKTILRTPRGCTRVDTKKLGLELYLYSSVESFETLEW